MATSTYTDAPAAFRLKAARATASPGAPLPESSDFDDSAIGIVKTDLHREVTYANPAAMRMLGLSSYKGVHVDSFFADAESLKKLEHQIKRRLEGMIGNYQVNVRRKSDGAVIPIQVTGVPIKDAEDKIVGALGMYVSLERQNLINDIHKLNRSAMGNGEFVKAIAERVRKSIPFDVMVMSRYSSDLKHAYSFFVTGLDVPRKRWIQLDERQAAWVSEPGVRLIPDMQWLLENDEIWKSMREEPFVQSLLAIGCKSVLLRPVFENEGSEQSRLRGSISFLRTTGAFGAEHQELLGAIPLDASVIRALTDAESKQVAARLNLVRLLNQCTSVKEASKLLAWHLARKFGSHVSVFYVDWPAKLIRLVEQHAADEEKDLRMSEPYDHPIEAGVLGRVVREGQLVNLGNVRAENSGYVAHPGWGDRIASELCCPIGVAGQNRWIVNIEDSHPNAFSTDECEELLEIAKDVGAVLSSIHWLHIFRLAFDHTSDPIFVTDATLKITMVNQAAAMLLGCEGPASIVGNLADLFPGVDLSERVARENGVRHLGELSMLVAATRSAKKGETPPTIPVFVSQEPFVEGLDGHVFVARDMRQIRRSVQLELFEQAAYEVAVEVSSPLSLAIAGIEQIPANTPHAATLGKVLRQLGRVRRAYTKLAMFNPAAQPKPADFARIHLHAELDAIIASLTDEDRARVKVRKPQFPPVTLGDPFQISFVLETLLSLLIRSAPAKKPVRAEFAAADGSIVLNISGYLPTPSASGTSSVQATLQIARPLIEKFIGNHDGAKFASNALEGGRHEFVLRFPGIAAA